jgi:hypothetical protein
MPFDTQDLGNQVAQAILGVFIIFFCMSAPMGFIVALIIRRIVPMYERSRLEIISVGFVFALVSVVIFSILLRVVPIPDIPTFWVTLAASLVLATPIVLVGFVLVRWEIAKSEARTLAKLNENPEDYSYWDDRARGKAGKEMRSFNRPRRK